MPKTKRGDIGRRRRCEVSAAVCKKKRRVERPVLSASSYDSNENYEGLAQVGKPERKCEFCAAMMWKDEPKGFCCLSGSVQLPALPPMPPPLASLLTCNDPRSHLFFGKIRSYNNALAMTSIGCNEIREENFMPTFKISGQLHHRIGSLLPMDESPAKFLQIYFVGNDDTEASMRCNYSETENLSLMKELQTMLHSHNHYVRELKCVAERVVSNQSEDVKIAIRDSRIAGAHQRQTNGPSVNEVAVVISVDDTTKGRDIIIEGIVYSIMFCTGLLYYSFIKLRCNQSFNDYSFHQVATTVWKEFERLTQHMTRFSIHWCFPLVQMATT